VFRDRLLRPILEECAPPSMAEVCRRHGLASESGASNMIVTVKRRFHNALKRQLRATVLSDTDAEEEWQDMLRTWGISAQDIP
jgi:hypothetical protein